MVLIPPAHGRNAVIRNEEDDRFLLYVRAALFFRMGSSRGKGLTREFSGRVNWGDENLTA